MIDGHGVFQIVCLSKSRSDEQQSALFVNVIKGEFKARDFNRDKDVSAETIRKGCPTRTSGADEDALSTAVAVKILTDAKIYNNLMNGI